MCALCGVLTDGPHWTEAAPMRAGATRRRPAGSGTWSARAASRCSTVCWAPTAAPPTIGPARTTWCTGGAAARPRWRPIYPTLWAASRAWSGTRPIRSTPPWSRSSRQRRPPGAARPGGGGKTDGGYARLTPVIVVTGFLGSGKTTLLNRMLRHPSLADAAVLVNEFGAVGIDHFLVEAMDENTVLLESGCLCCTIRGDLKDAIIDLNSRARPRRDSALPAAHRRDHGARGPGADPLHPQRRHGAEASLSPGLGDHDGGWRERLRQLKRHPESVKQATVADRIVLTKPDIADTDTLARLRAKLTRLNRSADQITAVNGKVDVPRVLRADVYDARTKARRCAAGSRPRPRRTRPTTAPTDTSTTSRATTSTSTPSR